MPTDAEVRAAAAGVSPGHYLSGLESLRGLAILLVFWFHVEGVVYIPYGRPNTALPFQSLVRAGHTGVSLFFVLSAFLLSLPFLRESRGGPHLSLSRYAVRRGLRIVPLYWTAVLVGAVLSAATAADLWHAVPHLLFLSGFAGWAVPLNPYGNVWWSLVTEVQFYLLLPLLPLCRRWRWGGWLGGALLLAYGLAYLLFQAGIVGASTVAGQYHLCNSIIGRGPQFLVGGAAAWLYLRLRARPARAAPAWWRNGGADAALLATLYALSRLLDWVMAGGRTRFVGVPYHAWHTLEALLWAAVILLILLAPLRSIRLWDNPVFERLGLLSYSIYMWHMPLAWFGVLGFRRLGIVAPARWTWTTLLEGLAVAAVCLALSALTYRYIERPFLVRKARLR